MEISKNKAGIVVASEHIPHVDTVALGFWVRCGTLYEGESEQGLSHFLEHLFFKGSQERSARDIVEAIDNVGGELNAYTTKEYTCFYVKVLKEHLGLAVDVLSNMLSAPKLSVSDVEKEKQIVLEEIALYEDTPDELIHDYLATTIWPHHPLGLPILGNKESIMALNREKCWDFYRRHYQPRNIVITAAGNLLHQQLVELVEEKLKLDGEQGGDASPATATAYSERSCFVDKPTEQLHICLGFPGLAWQHEDIYTLSMLNNILGAGMSSRLFQLVREEMGLAYNIYSYSASFVENGYYGIYAGLSPRNAEQLVTAIGGELKAMKNGLVSAAELARAREQVKGAIVMGLESTANRMSRMGRGLLLVGEVTPTLEIVNKIEAVTPDDIQRLAERLLKMGSSTICALGPTKDLPDLSATLHAAF
ncbi:MAG: insulinase family protein [Firmicutes bacterium]|nr:insulinase family protein [Dethiobacter sp.]MBS3888697.1 insulinase family protein [Bacillota bacterium]